MNSEDPEFIISPDSDCDQDCPFDHSIFCEDCEFVLFRNNSNGG